MNIDVNGKRTPWASSKITYEDIVSIAWGAKNVEFVYTVTYRHSASGVAGTLSPGKSVEVREGMIINCFDTSNA